MGASIQVMLWIAIAYLAGSIPVGLLVAGRRGVDLRQSGSGNIGATNVSRTLGASAGVMVFALDAAKAGLPVFVASRPWALGESPWALALVGVAAVLGHIFSIFLGFKGGKGVACSLGVILAIDPPVAFAAMLIYGQTLWLTRTSAVGSLTAVTSMVLALWIADRPGAYQVMAIIIATMIWGRHVENVRSLVLDAKSRKEARSRLANTSQNHE